MPRSPVSGQVRLNGAFISADPPKVVPLAQQPSFVRVARNSLRVGRTLLQRWWGEAVLAKVRLHVPVDYFRIANDSPAIRKFAYSLSRTLKAGRKYRISAGVSIRNILDTPIPGRSPAISPRPCSAKPIRCTARSMVKAFRERTAT